MLLLMFFLPALVNCNNCSRLQHKTPRKRPTYTFDLNAETQDIQHYDVLITDISIGVLNKFWKSTGLCLEI